MPNQDGTGPNGKGPQTGRGLGKCNSDVKNLSQKPCGRGYGLGMRRQARKTDQ